MASIKGSVELVVELKSPADTMWEAIKDFAYLLPKVLVETYKSIEVVEGDDGKSEGSVTLWNFAPCTLVEGAPATMVEKKKIEGVDEFNKTLFYSVVSGDMLELYKTFNPVISVTPKPKAKGMMNNNYDDHEGGGGSIVKWSVKFEKVNQMVPDPLMIKAVISNTLHILDAHLLHSQILKL